MTRSTRFAILPVALLLVAAPAYPQDIITSSFAVPVYGEGTAAGPYYPGPSVPRFPVPQTFPLPPTGFPLGDLTMDNATGIIWHTNGFLITGTNHPAYPALAPIPLPFPGPAMIGPLTGLAIDSATATLWCTDGVMCVGVLLAPGLPVVFPPFPLPVLAIAAMPVTGLDWDPLTGSLWAVDVAGSLYNFLPGPIPIGAQPVMPPMGPAPAVDVVLDRHPAGIPGIYVQFFGGTINYMTGIPSPTLPPVPIGSEDGIAYHAYPDVLPSGCICPPGPATVVGTLGPTSLGNAGFGFTLAGVVPFAACVFALDLVAALPPLPFPGGCALYLFPASPTLLLIPVVATGAGVATLPVSLVLPPALLGITAFTQWGYPCAAAPLGVMLSDSQQFILEAP